MQQAGCRPVADDGGGVLSAWGGLVRWWACPVCRAPRDCRWAGRWPCCSAGHLNEHLEPLNGHRCPRPACTVAARAWAGHRRIFRFLFVPCRPRRARGSALRQAGTVLRIVPVRAQPRTSCTRASSGQSSRFRPCLRLVDILALMTSPRRYSHRNFHPISSRPCWAHTLPSSGQSKGRALRLPLM